LGKSSGAIHLYPLPIEALTLCAYTDGHFARHREYWRTFMKILLPTLLERDPAEVEELVEHSVVRDWTELIQDNKPRSDVGALIRHMSASLSLFVGHPGELGFASFLDCSLPTRLHALPGALRRRQPADGAQRPLPVLNEGSGIDDVFIEWFSRLALVQVDDHFGRTIAQWQQTLAELPMTHLQPVADVDEGEGAA
jgi:hypothetical protein